MTNPCFCTGPDRTGKCRCQRGEKYFPPTEEKQKDMLHWYNQGYFDELMDQANKQNVDK